MLCQSGITLSSSCRLPARIVLNRCGLLLERTPLRAARLGAASRRSPCLGDDGTPGAARSYGRQSRPAHMTLATNVGQTRPRPQRRADGQNTWRAAMLESQARTRERNAKRTGGDARDDGDNENDSTGTGKLSYLQRRRAPPEGPFGGMNQTVARIDTSRRGGNASSSVTRLHRQDSSRGVDIKRKALKMQSALATVPYVQRNRTKERISEIESFDDFKSLLRDVRQSIEAEALRGMVDVKPTPVQKLAIPALLGQEDSVFRSKEADAGRRGEFLLAAETGSGKTLAYLLPVVHALKVAEMKDHHYQAYRKRMEDERELAAAKMAGANDGHGRRGGGGQRQGRQGDGRGNDLVLTPNRKRRAMDDEPSPTMARPKVVILVPTAELADQVGHVAKLISHRVKFKADILSAAVAPMVIRRNMYSPMGVDLVVATPHLLGAMAQSDPAILSQVSHLVVDEADSLLDRNFADETTAIIDRAMPSLRQLVFCTATVPRRLDSFVSERFPNAVRITTPNLHAIPRRVQLGVLDIAKEPYRGSRDLACADAIYSIGKEGARPGEDRPDEVELKRVLVFVNERDRAQPVAEYLRSKGIDAVAFHRDTSELRLTEMLASFTAPGPKLVPVDASAQSSTRDRDGRRSLANVQVIVGTDLISRGIDTLAVRHVILYDVPHTVVDFIHRLGRAGRMNRRGRGIVLVGNNDRRDIVSEIKASMFMGQALI